jgi:hypothetical protein
MNLTNLRNVAFDKAEIVVLIVNHQNYLYTADASVQGNKEHLAPTPGSSTRSWSEARHNKHNRWYAHSWTGWLLQRVGIRVKDCRERATRAK